MTENGNLPPNWILSTLGEICSQPQYGYTTKASDSGNLHLLRTTDITSGQIDWNSVPYCSENPADVEKYLLESGDIVISRAGSVGFSYLLENPRRAVFASYLIRFKPFVDKKFFKYFLQSPNYWNEISENQLGIAVPNVNANKLKAIPIPLPPLNEQKRIVAKIEELFAELDAGVASLELAQAQLQTYRQALLKHAFEGKLTEQWRTANADKLEDAATLLQRIKAERQAHHQAELAAWKEEVKTWETNCKPGNKPSKPRPPKDLPPLTLAELDELPQLPAGWDWATMSEVWLDSVLGKMLDKQKNKGEFEPYLRNINVRWGSFDTNDLLEMRFESDEHERYGLKDGDLVICEGGEPGRCAVWREKYLSGIKIQKALHRVRFPQRVDPYFIQKYFELCASSKRLEEFFTGTTIKHLTGQGLAKVPIPICSVAEQNEILFQLEERLSNIDQLELTITTVLQQAEALRQSILKKAFAGQLVPQDPNDEPASALLARIRAVQNGNR